MRRDSKRIQEKLSNNGRDIDRNIDFFECREFGSNTR